MNYSPRFGWAGNPACPLAFLAVAIGAWSACSDAQAVVFAQEQFDYTLNETPPTPLANLNGGTGFTEAWSSATTVGVTVEAGSLSFPGYTTIGNSIRYGASSNVGTGGRNWGPALTDSVVDELGNLIPEDVWFSFLVKPNRDTSVDPEARGAGGTFSPLMRIDPGNNGVQNGFGLRIDDAFNDASAAGSDGLKSTTVFKAWHPTGYSGTVANSVIVPNGFNQTYFVVGRVQYTVDNFLESSSAVTHIAVYDAVTGLPTEEPTLLATDVAGDNQTVVYGAIPRSPGGVDGSGNPLPPLGTLMVRKGFGGRSFGGRGVMDYDEILIGSSFADVIPSSVPPLQGDANGDGNVDLLDLDILGANFGVTGTGTLAQGDFNNDQNIDLLDLDILGANFGSMATQATAVPEPATAVGLLVVVLSTISGRQRS